MVATLLLIFLWIILGLLLLILVIASAPVLLRAKIQSSPHRHFQLQISPLGGLMPYLPVVDSTRARKKTKSRAKRRKKQGAGKGLPSPAGQRMIRNAPRLLGDILHLFKFRRLVVDARFGLGDPADTGAVFGILCPFIFGTPPAQRLNIRVVPDYERACLDGRAEATVAVIPLGLIQPVARFSWRSFGPRGMR